VFQKWGGIGSKIANEPPAHALANFIDFSFLLLHNSLAKLLDVKARDLRDDTLLGSAVIDAGGQKKILSRC
jgi:hypothetical protein